MPKAKPPAAPNVIEKSSEPSAPTEIEKLNAKNFAGQAHPGALAGVAMTRTRQYVVACKLGVPYYKIQHTPLVEKQQMGNQGMRTVMEAEPTGPVVILRGTARPRGALPEGFPDAPLIVDGAALNFGIDADWFDEWLEQHKRDPLVINKMIFAREKEADVRSIAKEHTRETSGLEPVNPKGDARMPKSTRAEVADVSGAGKTAQERNAG